MSCDFDAIEFTSYAKLFVIVMWLKPHPLRHWRRSSKTRGKTTRGSTPLLTLATLSLAPSPPPPWTAPRGLKPPRSLAIPHATTAPPIPTAPHFSRWTKSWWCHQQTRLSRLCRPVDRRPDLSATVAMHSCSRHGNFPLTHTPTNSLTYTYSSHHNCATTCLYMMFYRHVFFTHRVCIYYQCSIFLHVSNTCIYSTKDWQLAGYNY